MKIPLENHFVSGKFAFLTYAIDQQASCETKMDPKRLELLKKVVRCKKPDFLPKWHQEDWLLFCFSVLSIGDLQPDAMKRLLNPEAGTPNLEKAALHYQRTYEKYFSPLNADKMNIVRISLLAFQTLKQIFPVNSQTSQGLIPFEIQNFAISYPLYNETFQSFWKEFTSFYGVAQLEIDYFYIRLILLSLAHTPAQQVLPKIKLYIQSDQSLLYNQYLESRLASMLSSIVMVEFVPYKEASDLTISLLNSDHVPTLKERLIFLNVPLQEKDLYYVIQYIRENFTPSKMEIS